MGVKTGKSSKGSSKSNIKVSKRKDIKLSNGKVINLHKTNAYNHVCPIKPIQTLERKVTKYNPNRPKAIDVSESFPSVITRGYRALINFIRFFGV